MGKTVGHVGVEANVGEEFGHTLAVFAFVVHQPVHGKRFADNVAGSHAGIQRAVWILENYLHLAAHGPHLTGACLSHINPVEQYLAFGRLVQAEDAAPGGGFTATGFAYQAQRLAPAHGEADVVNRLDIGYGALEQNSGGNGEVHLQTAHFQKRIVLAGRR